jgi:hypothetical protein
MKSVRSINIDVRDLFDVVIIKHTGLSGRATEVNSISYKTVDSATYLDSIDSLNYPIRSPYGTKPKNVSYESWVKFKLRIYRKYKKCLNGTSLQLPCFEEDCTDSQVYTKVTDLKLWIKFQCFSGYDVKYGFSTNYVPPVRSDSIVAIHNIKEIQTPTFNNEYSITIPIGDGGEMLLGEIEDYESDFFVSQLTAFKGCQFQNSIMKVGVHYNLA